MSATQETETTSGTEQLGSRSKTSTSRRPSGNEAANSGWPTAKRPSGRTSRSPISVRSRRAWRTADGNTEGIPADMSHIL